MIVMGFVYVISTMETLGDIAGTLAAVGRSPTTRELRGGLLADGVLSGLYILEYMAKTGKTPSQLVQHLFSEVGPPLLPTARCHLQS